MIQRLTIIIICIIFVFLWGCVKKPIIKPEPVPPVVEDTGEEPSARFIDWQSIPELKTINFDFDKSDLSQYACKILSGNAQYLKSHQELDIIVEGHCDERGSSEYNLALGQHRASIVREYYGKLGIKLSRIATISYGEEKPVDSMSREDAWAKNRRAETKIRLKK
ncbi:MAG: peptidoglycan-associated lipoprotein [Elusimicrobia bacterium CG_4_10_14_0_8_um_filter_37_32]|nr:MAG: peptidoglycan-associated lipoprotein [Elusimicrobia bacterium CG02_land_8_20_14_3_00_37_13]PIZ13600.1 MAG: peptidoglycan-associated lipoprotein [Elusimicrobia bacterium CG_4_10_14_0_8_um_filter_37_32]